MNSFNYTNFEDAITFARSQNGAAFIKENYAGTTAKMGMQQRFNDIYRTPSAAALAALAACREDEIESLDDYYSVTTIRYRDKLFYAADTGHTEDMTHTDKEGFISFLKGNDWQDSEWIQKIDDL